MAAGVFDLEPESVDDPEPLLPELDDEVSLELLPSVDVLSDELDSDFDEDAPHH